MKKYIDAEGLRETIEKIINSIESCPFIEAEFGAEMRREGEIQAYNKILALIDALQQEQQEVDLEKEIEEYFPESAFYTGWNYDDVVEVARDFWNKGYNARKQ